MSDNKLEQKPLPGLETKVVTEEKKVKKHPLLGPYVDVTVVPLMEIDMKNTGFVSIGAYTAEYKYNTKQSFPELVVKFLEERTQKKRSYKETYDEETGPSKEIIVKETPRFNVIRH